MGTPKLCGADQRIVKPTRWMLAETNFTCLHRAGGDMAVFMALLGSLQSDVPIWFSAWTWK
jgi:hypothetical protein